MSIRKAVFILAACLACSGQVFANEWVNEFLVHRTPSYTLDGAEGCLRCHSGEKMRNMEKSVHGDADNPATPAASHGCESCHGAGSVHVSRAHGGRGFPPLTRFGRGSGTAPREEQLQACLACHAGPGDGARQIAFAATVHDRGSINCSTCHTVHAETDPMSERQRQSETCFRCHRRIQSEHPQMRGRGVDLDRFACSMCHKLHRSEADLQ